MVLPPFNGVAGAEPPDPQPGKPGHFAWSNWIKACVKALDARFDALAVRFDALPRSNAWSAQSPKRILLGLELLNAIEVTVPVESRCRYLITAAATVCPIGAGGAFVYSTVISGHLFIDEGAASSANQETCSGATISKSLVWDSGATFAGPKKFSLRLRQEPPGTAGGAFVDSRSIVVQKLMT